jgi:glycosyltransferase involved in cell wall biosynthesis
MKVQINISRLHPVAFQRGVGFYTFNLFKALNNLKDGHQYLLEKKRKREVQADLIHYPYFDPFFLTLPRQRSKPTIVTIHDLIPLKFPRHYPSGIKGKIKWQIQRGLVKKVSAIITDSQNSKKDIIDIISFPPEKIFPIYLAAGKEFRKLEIGNWKLEIKEKYHLPENFLLYVGDLNWNKNLKAMMIAFKKLKIKNLKMVFIGRAFKDEKLDELEELKGLMRELKLENDVRFLGFIPTRDLVAIYNLATLHVQPSFSEGFGLPVLEAMSCGCPVLCSNQASLPEVGGPGVEYFNPYKKGDLVKKLNLLLANKDKLKEFRLKGLKQAKDFSWKKTALATRKVYEKVLS